MRPKVAQTHDLHIGVRRSEKAREVGKIIGNIHRRPFPSAGRDKHIIKRPIKQIKLMPMPRTAARVLAGLAKQIGQPVPAKRPVGHLHRSPAGAAQLIKIAVIVTALGLRQSRLRLAQHRLSVIDVGIANKDHLFAVQFVLHTLLLSV